MSRWDRLRLQTLYRLAPEFPVERIFDATWLTHDETERQLATDDSLFHSTVSAGLIKWLVDSGNQSLARAGELPVNTLVLVPEADQVVSPDGAREFCRRAPAERITLKQYPESYHEVFNETPELRDLAMRDLTDWLAQEGGVG